MKVWADMFAHIPDIIRFSTGRIDSKVYETTCTMYHATGHEAQQCMSSTTDIFTESLHLNVNSTL